MTSLAKQRSEAGLEAAPAPRREVRELSPSTHGGLDFSVLRRLGLRPCDVLDFSANINPYGPSPVVRPALAAASVEQYPDRECTELRRALAEWLGSVPQRILPSNGSSELIGLAALAFIRPGDRVLVLGPTFGEYARAARIVGGRVSTWQARESARLAFEPTRIADKLTSLRPRLVFLCNPNNPTGAVLAPDIIADWARQHRQSLFVIDEAYLPFAAGLGSALAFATGNVVVLRSMTKDFGLAGLRLGFAVGDEGLIEMLGRVQPPWSVNAMAQAAGIAALGDLAHRQHSLECLAQDSEELAVGLSQLGFSTLPSATHFFLVRVGDAPAFRAALLRRGILVRDCTSFGLPAHIRIAARRPEENQRLLAAVREVIR
jgi:L-threonine-O-3-phosphate decarboxylase